MNKNIKCDLARGERCPLVLAIEMGCPYIDHQMKALACLQKCYRANGRRRTNEVRNTKTTKKVVGTDVPDSVGCGSPGCICETSIREPDKGAND